MNKKINILNFLEQLYKPIICISVFISITTFLVYFQVLASESAIFSVLTQFDLNKAETIANWFSRLIWIILGLSFYMLGRKNVKIKESEVKVQVIFLLLGIVLCLISFEKIFQFHLIFEFRVINLLGFSSSNLREDSLLYWFYVFIIPFLLFFLIIFIFAFYKLIKGVNSAGLKKKVLCYLIAAIICMMLSVSFEIVQEYYWYADQKRTVFNSIESVLELAGICCFIICNKALASYYTH